MHLLYRIALCLYPAVYRREFGNEMAAVFDEARTGFQHKSTGPRVFFYAREVHGLLCGAVSERLRQLTGSSYENSILRFDMKPQFRFPRSTVALMTVILAGVVMTIEKAMLIQVKYDSVSAARPVWFTMPSFALVGFGFVFVAALASWAILHALRRSGVYRMSNVQPGINSAVKN